MSFPIKVSFRGQTATILNVTITTTAKELHELVLDAFVIPKDELKLKLIYKGKRLDDHDNNQTRIVFPKVPSKTPKILVMATSEKSVKEISNKRSDPTIRGFENEGTKAKKQQNTSFWGSGFVQDRNYKFCRFEACTWHSFGHRPTEGTTPHAFEAMQLLEKMANDPGVVAVMKERELVVGTLGEMDPIDDRVMQKKEAQGSCLLGYNTNRGLRIDIKLRTEDLAHFRPYPELVTTLIHELSHNWVGEHNLLFWTNYGQMRTEYLFQHAMLRSGSQYTMVHGKTTAQLAELNFDSIMAQSNGKTTTLKEHVFQIVMQELTTEMAQHGLHPSAIAQPIQQRCQELQDVFDSNSEQRLGGNDTQSANNNNARELALAAAERRFRKQQQQQQQNHNKHQGDPSA